MVNGGLRHSGVTPARGRRGDDVTQGGNPHRWCLDDGGVDGVDAERRTGEAQVD
jgi:hypothetical protein